MLIYIETVEDQQAYIDLADISLLFNRGKGDSTLLVFRSGDRLIVKGSPAEWAQRVADAKQTTIMQPEPVQTRPIDPEHVSVRPMNTGNIETREESTPPEKTTVQTINEKRRKQRP